MRRNRGHAVEIGDRFQMVAPQVCDGRQMVWQVVALHPWQYGPDHAELMRLDDRFERKSISVAALTDRSLFLPVARMAAAE